MAEGGVTEVRVLIDLIVLPNTHPRGRDQAGFFEVMEHGNHPPLGDAQCARNLSNGRIGLSSEVEQHVSMTRQ